MWLVGLSFKSNFWWKDELCEASWICFQSCRSEAWYHKKVSGKYFMIDCSWELLWVMSCRSIEYCLAVLWSFADWHHKLLNRVVMSVIVLAGGVWEYNNPAHRRSVSVLCITVYIRSTLKPNESFAVCTGLYYMWPLFWLLISNRLCLIGAELFLTVGPLCPYKYHYGTIS